MRSSKRQRDENAIAFVRLVIRMRIAAQIIVEKQATKQNLRAAARGSFPIYGT